ncbi:sigma 54-interacting transcriptional regulator [Escherichia coli]|nr:sigma 54-interacting transcriptional regulator [Escherichia coli]EKY5819185.1 sigma 54-interacting transcriptional regulator [Escherichia coli]
MNKFNKTTSFSTKEILLSEVVSTIIEQLTQQSERESILRCFIPFPPLFSPIQFIELHFIENNFYYRCFDDGSFESSQNCWAGDVSDVSSHMILAGGILATELRYVRTDGGVFSSQDIALFAWLTRMITSLLENLLEKERLHATISSLIREREHEHILVNITNSILMNLDMESLIRNVAEEIHRYFGISHISFVLHIPDKPDSSSVWKSDFSGELHLRESTLLNKTSMVLQTVLQYPVPVLFSLQENPELWRTDPLLTFSGTPVYNTVFALPLCFGNRISGILLLAHDSSDLFDNENKQLLQYIANRIAIAVDSADTWHSVSVPEKNIKQEKIKLNEKFLSRKEENDIIYSSQLMQELLMQVDIVAQSDSTVLICGETGTGKEVIAHAVHKLSQRKNRPLVKINCSAIPASLLESELFGYDKGAFTGAINTHRGRFEIADGGTLFLDEIGDLPLELQPKLLRVLQEREIERLGGIRPISVDVRIIAATNRDLTQMVEDNKFRSDLFYRLNVFPLEIPPLRERPEDIPLLAKYFTTKFAHRMNRVIDIIPSEVMSQLISYNWPGNIRELENVIERAVLLTRGNSLDLHLDSPQTSLLPMFRYKERTTVRRSHILNPAPPENDEEERARIIQILHETNGIVAGPRGAAQRLGIKRTTLLSRMQRLGISPRKLR